MDYAEFYADGAFHPCGGAAVLPVYNPATEQAEASVRACSADDLERAVRAAAAAGPGWGARGFGGGVPGGEYAPGGL
ncbi:hypothetical protein [Bordetella bronchiseptica]|uniref:hypothetical protein n=1 Tax=Bordetella bronchiseptica TaxID=518 RepID=UPI003EDC1B31